MYSANDASYLRARALKKGEAKLALSHQEMVDWLSNQFEVRALDFKFETKNISPTLHQQVIGIILETVADSIQIDSRENRMLIIERFIAYLKTTDLKTEQDVLKQDAWPFPSDPSPEIILAFHPLEALEWRVAWDCISAEIITVKNQFDFIYTILVNNISQTIFFYKDEQLTETNKAATLNALLMLLKKHDEFGYFGLASFSNTTYFDSQENLDKNYGGDPFH